MIGPLRFPAALLDHAGAIMATSRAWTPHSQTSGLSGVVAGVGQIYLEGLRESDDPNAPTLAEGLQRVLSGEVVEFTVEYRCEAGALTAWFEFWVGTHQHGLPGAVMVTHRDISARKRIEHDATLRGVALNEAHVPVVIANKAGVIEWANPAFSTHTGYDLEEALGKTPGALLKSGQHDAAFYQNMWQTLAKGEAWRGRITNRRKNGTLSHEELAILPVRGADGAICNYVAVKHDLSEQERAKEALRRSEQLQEGIIAGSPIPIFSFDNDGLVLSWNAAAERVFGWTADEVLGKPLPTIPDDRLDESLKMRERVLKEGRITGFEVERRHKDGRLIELRMSGAPIRDESRRVAGIMAMAEELSAERVAQREREQRTAQYQSLFENNHAVMMVVDPDSGVIVDANPAAVHYYGWPRERLISMRVSDINLLSDEQVEEEMRAAKAQQRSHFVFRHRRADGSVRDVEVYSGPIVLHGRELLYSIVHDITQRKRAERRVKHLNLVLRALRRINQLIARERDRAVLIQEAANILVELRGYSFVLIVLLDEENRPAHWAEAGTGPFFSSFGPMLSEGRLPPCFDCHEAPGELQVVRDRMATCSACPMNEHAHALAAFSVALMHEGKRFGYMAVSLPTELAMDPDERAVFEEVAADLAHAMHIMERDELHRRRAEEQESLKEQLAQSQRMESVGRLAGGVAHDFNNMLGVMRGYAEMALAATGENSPIHLELKGILDAANRAAEITRRLLAFARKQTIEPIVLDLNDTIEGTLRMLRRLIGEEIDLHWEPTENLWRVKMDASQVDQLLANLCVNARDAIGGNGSITISTRNARVPKAKAAASGLPDGGDFVEVTVSDTGCGIEEGLQRQIFEPFFTTKGVGEGTGLGLSTVYGILQQNGGFITVESEQGKGTTLHLYMPRHRGEIAEGSAEAKGETPTGRGEHILLVEDEAALRHVTTMMLTRLGYRVTPAATPWAALEAIAADPAGFDLLLTDVVMPEMDGNALAVRVQEAVPGLATLFMSGYPADVISKHNVLDEGVQFIHKPYEIGALARKVRTILDGA